MGCFYVKQVISVQVWSFCTYQGDGSDNNQYLLFVDLLSCQILDNEILLKIFKHL